MNFTNMILRGVILSSWLLLFAGCCVTAKIDLENQSGQGLRVFSGTHEEVETAVEPKKTRSVPHVSGPIKIVTEAGATWRYGDIDVPIIVADAPAFRKKWGIMHTQLRLHLLVESDGKVYAIPVSRADRDKYHSIQPSGFPRTPDIQPADSSGDKPSD